MGALFAPRILRVVSPRRSHWSLTALLSVVSCAKGSDGVDAGLPAQLPTAASSTQDTHLPSTTSTPTSVQDCRPGQKQRCIKDGLGKVHPLQENEAKPLGGCQAGTRTCSANGVWSNCRGAIGPTRQDLCHTPGDDSNCNGVPNEGCSCVPPEQGWRVCGSNIGACKPGKQYCVDGAWGRCEGERSPTPEQCDGRSIDEDCDEKTDRDDPDCECLDTDFQTCTISGARGDCQLGVKTCDKGRWTACRPRFPRQDRESCAVPRIDAFGLALGDEDCDGEIDNANGRVRPDHCKMYIVDDDNDGWGKLGFSYIETKTHPELGDVAYGCFCTKPEGLSALKESIPGRENRDCCETSDRYYKSDLVHPGQTHYFAKPSTCLSDFRWKGGMFDYNCDNKEERLFTETFTGNCIQLADKSCAWENKTGTWKHNRIPNCGVQDPAPTCQGQGTAENPCRISGDDGGELVTQRCR